MKTAKPVPIAFQREGASVILLGGFGQTSEAEFGSTQYAKVILNQLWGTPPKLDMAYEKRVHEAMRAIVEAGLAESAHDLSDGGLAIALSESCTTSLGAQVAVPQALSPALFGEAPSRILVTTSNPDQIQAIAKTNNIESVLIGVTIKERLRIDNVIDVPTADLKQTFEESLPRLLKGALA
jgi:phosphoribosylformylglycinamidine synthase